MRPDANAMPTFRTVEISDPRFETENLREITVKSPSLAGRADITVWIASAARAARDLPLILLLHGVYGSHWAWVRQGGAHRLADSMVGAGVLPPCVLAMPSDGLWGDGSGYVSHREQDFERWIVEEVPAAVQQAAPCVGVGSRWFIAGLSMGGFGALRLAERFPDRFAGAAALSAVTDLSQLSEVVEERLEERGVARPDDSVFDALLNARGRLPPLRFDCGTADPLLPANRELHRRLDDEYIAHTFEEFPGGHDWAYWEVHLADSLRFFGQICGRDSGASRSATAMPRG